MAGKIKKLTSKKSKLPAAPPKRDAVLFARIQKENKDWLDKQAKATGFSDTASFIDAFVGEARINLKD